MTVVTVPRVIIHHVITSLEVTVSRICTVLIIISGGSIHGTKESWQKYWNREPTVKVITSVPVLFLCKNRVAAIEFAYIMR